MVRDRVRWRHIAVVVLFIGVVFGALVQAGVLMPKFGVGSGGTGGTSSDGSSQAVYANTVENQSLRSWTIIGLGLPQGRTESLPDGSKVHIGGVYRGADVMNVLQGHSPALVPPLTIGPGQQLTVTLVREFPPACRKPIDPRSLAQFRNLEAGHPPPPHDLPAVIAISTPLGSRTVATTFSVTYGCFG